LAPLACKTDKIDARVLATLSLRDLVPEIWAARPEHPARARAGPLPAAPRPRSRHAEEPHPRHVGRARPPVPGLWSAWRSSTTSICRSPRWPCSSSARAPITATSPCWSRLRGPPGSTPTPSPQRSATSHGSPRRPSCAASGLCPRVKQSGVVDARGPISKHGPKYLRWALLARFAW